MYKLLSRFVPTLLFLAMIAFGSTKALATNTQITVGPGTGGWTAGCDTSFISCYDPKWNAYVHLPSDYNPNNLYPTIIFFPGAGETSGYGTGSNAYTQPTTNASKLLNYGPNKYIGSGWNGNVTVDGQTVKFIVVSLQHTPQAAPPTMQVLRQKIVELKALYPGIDPNKLFVTGLSWGGWASGSIAPYLSETYAQLFPAGTVLVDAQYPNATSGYNDFLPYPTERFTEYAQHGGKLLNFDQVGSGGLGDGDLQTIVNAMNSAVSGTAQFIPVGSTSTITTSYPNAPAGHCCWDYFYGASGTVPASFTIMGCSQNIYEWMARQALNLPPSSGCSSSTPNTPPTANAGNDLTIQLPTNSVTLQGSGTDTDGTIASYAWTKTAGPSSGFITSPSSASTTVTNLEQGTYTFQLKVTDNQGAIGTDTVNVNVQPAANPNPVLIARYRMDADSVIWSNTTAEIRDDLNIRHGDAVSQTTASPFNTTPVTGEIGQALQFLPGIPGGYITLGSQPDLFNPTSNYTISLWLKRDGAAKSDANLLISQGENNGRQMSLYYRSDGALYSTVGGQTIWGTELTTPVATLGVWYHIALVNQDGTQTLYVNGVPIAEGVSGTATATNKTVFIGERLSATGTLSKSTKYESLDDIRFYTGALSGEEIEALATIQLIDACPNISGNQVTVPAGYYTDSTGSCWPIADPLVGIELTPTSAGTIDSDLSARNLQPGSTIIIPAGSYAGGITLSGIHGTAGNPIVIKNSSTGAVETSKITITDSTYFTLSGTGASGAKYGFKVYGPSGVSVTNGTSDYELNNIEVSNALVGMTLKIDPKKNDTDTVYPNFTVKNVAVHDNWLHDISGAGILAGYPATGKVGNLVPVRLDNVEVAYNLLENIGETAVQLTNTRDETNVHDNLIKNYATKATQNQFAISIANANARVNNNTIDGGSGPAIQLRTYGINNAGGNVIKNVMTKPMNKQAATISGQEQSAYEKDNPRMRLDAVENIIQQDFTGPAISSSTLALTGAVTNNLLCGITKLSLDNLVIASKGSDMSGNQLNTEKCASVPETPKEVSSAANEAVVTATTLNVRQSTSTESAIVGKLAQGTTVTMSQTQDSAIAPGWTAITSPIKGVVSSQYLDNAGASVKASNLTAGTTVQATTAVNIRVSPTTSSRIVDRLYKGQNATVYALSPVSDWLQVRTSSGRTGYVFAQYVVPVKK